MMSRAPKQRNKAKATEKAVSTQEDTRPYLRQKGELEAEGKEKHELEARKTGGTRWMEKRRIVKQGTMPMGLERRQWESSEV